MGQKSAEQHVYDAWPLVAGEHAEHGPERVIGFESAHAVVACKCGERVRLGWVACLEASAPSAVAQAASTK